MEESKEGAVEVDAAEAARRLHEGARLLDVREQHEWDAGHVPGALHVPLGRLRTTDLDHAASWLVICRSGVRSLQATLHLRERGHSAANVAGGVIAWLRGGLPLQDRSGGPGRVA